MFNQEENTKKLTAKESRFVSNYCQDFNATASAIRAGYSKKSASNIGYENLRKPHIKAAVDAKLKDLGLAASETTKLLSDIARTSLNDFFRIVEKEHTPRVKKPLLNVIQDLQRKMEFEEAFAQKIKMEGEELAIHQKQQAARERQIIRLELTLARNPFATLFVDGEPELRQEVELDLVKLVQAKETGRIKSITPSEYGYKVELYPADAALTNLARIHGLFNDKMKHEHEHKIDLKNIKTIKVVEVRRDPAA